MRTSTIGDGSGSGVVADEPVVAGVVVDFDVLELVSADGLREGVRDGMHGMEIEGGAMSNRSLGVAS